MTKTQAVPSTPATTPLERGRGPLILVLGILSIVMFGFLTGIPAWVMGHSDLKRMREGEVETSDEGLARAGMILGIIGTIISGLVLLIITFIIIGIFSFAGIMIFEATGIHTQERAIEDHLYALARDARTYAAEHGSYSGYEIPSELQRTDHEAYSATASADAIVFRGRATNRRGSIEVTLDRNGDLTDWVYRGAFSDRDWRETIRDRMLILLPAS